MYKYIHCTVNWNDLSFLDLACWQLMTFPLPSLASLCIIIVPSSPSNLPPETASCGSAISHYISLDHSLSFVVSRIPPSPLHTAFPAQAYPLLSSTYLIYVYVYLPYHITYICIYVLMLPLTTPFSHDKCLWVRYTQSQPVLVVALIPEPRHIYIGIQSWEWNL